MIAFPSVNPVRDASAAPKRLWKMFAMLIVIVLLVVAVVAVLSKSPAEAPTGEEAPAPGIEEGGEVPPPVSSSDEVGAIEQDLQDSELNSLDAELGDIEGEL